MPLPSTLRRWREPSRADDDSALPAEEPAVLLRRVSLCTTIVMVTGAFVGVRHLLNDHPIAAINALLMVLGVDLARRWTLARPDGSRVETGTHLWVGTCALAVLVSALTTGQDESVSMWNVVMAPALVAQFVSRRAGNIWLVIAIAMEVTAYLMPRFAGSVPQEVTPAGTEILFVRIQMTVVGFLALAFMRRVMDRHLGIIRAQAIELAQARDQALAASKAKSDFLANMSHELRTPIHGIVASLDLLRHDPSLSAAGRQHLEITSTSAAQAHRVIDDILDFTRIEAGATELDEVPFSARALVEDAVKVVRAVADQKGLTITVSVGEGLPALLLGDAGKILRILVNLLANAVKFTDAGGVAVAVTYEEGHLRITVVDTGIGIDPSERERLLEKFEQCDTSTTRRYGGTGLGLAISRELATMMGGTIEIEARPGPGATVRVSIPLPETDEAEPSAALAPIAPLPRLTPAATGERGPAEGPVVLVVEDNETGAVLAGEMLARVGCRSVWSPDGERALDVLRARDDVAAVLLDSHLPGMHGHEVARCIRQLPGREAVRIIAMTADLTPANRSGARQAGVDRFLAKPARVSSLRAVLREIGVVEPPFDVAPLREARALIGDGAPVRETARLQAILTAAHDDARTLTASLRGDPDTAALFRAAHQHLLGSLLYASELARKSSLDDRDIQLLARCLDTAIGWEDA